MSSNIQLKVPAVVWGRKNEKKRTFSLLATHRCTSNSVIVSPTNAYVSEDVKKGHVNVRVRDCGLFIQKHMAFVGASPDSIVECDCCGKGVVEVKCPYKYREVSLSDVVQNTDCCIDANFNLKQSHKWYEQVQFQMGVINVQYCDFVYWTPIDAVICRVERNDEIITSMFAKCSQLWFDHLLPELVTRDIENAGSNSVPHSADE